MSAEPDIVVLERVTSPAIANLIVQALKFEGIPAYVNGCLLQDQFAMYERLIGANCTDIQVPRSCLAEAQEFLQNMREAGKQLDQNAEGDKIPEE